MFKSIAASSVQQVSAQEFGEGSAGISLLLSDGTKLAAWYWRFVNPVLLNRINSLDQSSACKRDSLASIEEVSTELIGKQISQVRCDDLLGDLHITFSQGQHLQVFNFSKFDAWEILFADGSHLSSTVF